MTIRIAGFLSCLLALAALSFYSVRVGSDQADTIPEIVAGQGVESGQEIALTSDVTVTEIGASEFVAEQNGARIRVLIPPQLRPEWEDTRTDLKVGDHISLRGVCRKAGYLEARQYHVHKGRRLKIWISVAALLVAGGLIFKQVREGRNA